MGGDVLSAKDLSHPSPSSTGFPQLRPNSLDVVVILRHHPSEVLVDLHPLENVPADRELLAEGQSRRYRRLTLLPTFHPDLAFFRLHMTWVKGVNLHGAPFAP